MTPKQSSVILKAILSIVVLILGQPSIIAIPHNNTIINLIQSICLLSGFLILTLLWYTNIPILKDFFAKWIPTHTTFINFILYKLLILLTIANIISVANLLIHLMRLHN